MNFLRGQPLTTVASAFLRELRREIDYLADMYASRFEGTPDPLVHDLLLHLCSVQSMTMECLLALARHAELREGTGQELDEYFEYLYSMYASFGDEVRMVRDWGVELMPDMMYEDEDEGDVNWDSDEIEVDEHGNEEMVDGEEQGEEEDRFYLDQFR